MDSIVLWLALALAQFIAFSFIKPSFDHKWRKGFFQGSLVVFVTILIGWFYVTYHEHVRMDGVLNEMQRQMVQAEQNRQWDEKVLPAKKKDN
jgi:hypothetical protein